MCERGQECERERAGGGENVGRKAGGGESVGRMAGGGVRGEGRD